MSAQYKISLTYPSL